MQGRPGVNQPNNASQMVVEDHLKIILGKADKKPWKCSDNKKLPKSQHSVFGNFPGSHM